MRTEDVSDLIQEVTARLIVPRFRSLRRDEVEQKRPGDLVTVADREAEVALTEAFAAVTPGALVVGEEATFARPHAADGLAEAEHAWVIDPVDGTRNFASGSIDFGVMVAEVRAGRTVRSWIWQPLHDRLYVAERGAGASVNGEPLRLSASGHVPALVSGWTKLREAQAHDVRLVAPRGACAIDYARVASGALDALMARSLNPWDHLPGALLVEEAGGVARVDGQAYGPRQGGDMLVVGRAETVTAVERALGRV